MGNCLDKQPTASIITLALPKSDNNDNNSLLGK